ncbi:hypothetical protein N9X53_03750 [Mariniblastus sp.]|jgi:hypothetical protein|nr:hypothetical protein [Mariniblastus sp.]MDB2525781.1 hypothetical protein [Mariniblastus sp.]
MRVFASSFFLLLTMACSSLLAQTGTLDEKDKAVVVFDLRLDDMRNSVLGKKLGMEAQLAGVASEDEPGPNEIDRVFGAMSLPQSMQEAMMAQFGEVKFDFFVKVYFNTEAAVDKVLAEIDSDSAETVENDGKTFYEMPADGPVPAGLVYMQVVDSKTVELGTKKYLFHPNRKLLTDNLMAAAKDSPEVPIRMAMDFAGAKGLVTELVEMGKQQAGGNGPAGMFIDLLNNVQDLSIMVGMDEKDLLTIKATGMDDEKAKELRGGVDAMLGLAKMSMQQVMPMVEGTDPDAAKMLGVISKALKAKGSGREVLVKIPAPKGLGDFLSKQMENLPMLLQMGGQSGGGF